MNEYKIACKISKKISELPLFEEAYNKIVRSDSELQSMYNNIKEQIRKFGSDNSEMKNELLSTLKCLDDASSDLYKAIKFLNKARYIWEKNKG